MRRAEGASSYEVVKEFSHSGSPIVYVDSSAQDGIGYTYYLAAVDSAAPQEPVYETQQNLLFAGSRAQLDPSRLGSHSKPISGTPAPRRQKVRRHKKTEVCTHLVFISSRRFEKSIVLLRPRSLFASVGNRVMTSVF